MTSQKTAAIICVAFLIFAGCTTTYRVTNNKPKHKEFYLDLTEFSERTVGRKWTVTYVSGADSEAVLAAVSADSLVFKSEAGPIKVPITDVQSISERRYVEGAILDPILGTLVGGLGGFAIGGYIIGAGGWGALYGFAIGVPVGFATGVAMAIFEPPETLYDLSEYNRAR